MPIQFILLTREQLETDVSTISIIATMLIAWLPCVFNEPV